VSNHMWEMPSARLRDPVRWSQLTQFAKTVLAAVAAWVIAASVLDLPQPFLAPWSAILVVHATVYRTFSRGAQQVAATVVAVLLAAGIGQLMGLSAGAIALLLALSLLVGSIRWFGAEATTIATTALVVLTTGYENDTKLISRLLDTAIGVGVGLVVNLTVWPPLRRRTAALALNRVDDGIGELLTDMADGLATGCEADDVAGWLERSRDLDEELDHAWALVRQAEESARWNPRRSAREVRDPREWRELMHRMEQVLAETRSLAHTLGARGTYRERWGEAFAVPWLEMLGATGRAARDDNPAALHEVRGRLEALTEDLRATERSPEWPVYGALIINLRNIVDAMGLVAESNPIRSREG
jgi:uncharacterized membrane protein YccC